MGNQLDLFKDYVELQELFNIAATTELLLTRYGKERCLEYLRLLQHNVIVCSIELKHLCKSIDMIHENAEIEMLLKLFEKEKEMYIQKLVGAQESSTD